MGRNNNYTTEDRKNLVKKFKASGISQTEFAKQNGIPFATLNYWVASDKIGGVPYGKGTKRRGKAPLKKVVDKFIALDGNGNGHAEKIEAVFEGGAKLFFPVDMAPAKIREILTALS